MSPSAQSPLHVLMLEDSAFDAELVGEVLRANFPHAAIRVVADEAAFAAALAAGPVDVVLSDYELPGYSGAEALDRVRAGDADLPFIFVSGVIGEENAVEMLKRGATDYVSKNRLARLQVVIERALREAGERTRRERAERKLREADAIYGRVVDALQDYAVILLDEDGRIGDWNEGASTIFRLARADALGSPIARLFTPEDRAAGVVETELAGARANGSASDDRWLQRADGSRLRADGVLTALRDDAGRVTGFCKIVRDITRAYETAGALRDAKEQAERANRAKDRFLAVLSHELRTPPPPIASAAQLLERVAAVPAPHAGLLPMIRRNVALEARLIDDLLDVTAISAGKVTLQRERVDMREVVRAVVDILGEAVRAKGLALVTRWDATRTQVDGDAARLQQVLWNVVRNAIKFTPEGGHIELRVDDDGERLRLRCIDDGIGLPPGSQQRIFTAFEQAEVDTPRRFGGLGLGLSIARGLLLEHGGTLEAESAGPGRGATFTLTLPLLAQDAAAPAQAASAAPPADAQAVRMLLVEDNEDAAFAMALSFEYFGYRVRHASTIAHALAAVDAETFDVVVSDLGLPDGDGAELGKAIGDRLPLIALSGFGSAEDIARTAAAGFVAHLVKPADPDDIHAVVTRVLATWHAG